MAIFCRSFGGDGDDGRNGGCIIELPQVFVSETIASLAPRCFAVWMDARAGGGREAAEMRTNGRTDADGRGMEDGKRNAASSPSNFNIDGKSHHMDG